MAYFRITWTNGEEEMLEGATASEAYNSSYGAGAFHLVDTIKEAPVPTEGWELVKEQRATKALTRRTYSHKMGFKKVSLINNEGNATYEEVHVNNKYRK